MNKVLVTGATGFVGSYVVQQLLKQGYQIVATSSDSDKAKKKSWFTQVEYIPFNLEAINSSINYFQFFKNADLAIHLAWEGLPNYKSAFHQEINLPRHKAFLKNLIQNGLTDLTVIGTCLEYGMQEGKLKEDMPAIPSNSYAIAKDELRKFLQSFQKTHPFSFKWIRLFYMYGIGQNSGSLFSQLDKAIDNDHAIFNMSGGKQVRDYLPVEDVAEYIVKIALQKNITGIINCCRGKPATIKSLVDNYLKQKNKSIQLNLSYYPYPDYEPMQFWGDDSKLKTILNNE